MSGRIFSMPEPDRTIAVRKRTDELVVLVVHPVRGSTDLEEKHPGELLGVATTPNGTSANLAILRDLGGNLRAISLATIASIDSPTVHGLLDDFASAIAAGRLRRYR